jgi:DNA-binding MarR family transcriptional regulator
MASASEVSALLDKIRATQGNAWAATDLIASGTPLTAARFTLLRTISTQSTATTVPSLARCLAVSRQAVQRLVDGLTGEGILTLRPNPHHQKAPLVMMTAEGMRLFRTLDARHREWLADLAANFSSEEMNVSFQVLHRLQTLISKSKPEEAFRESSEGSAARDVRTAT